MCVFVGSPVYSFCLAVSIVISLLFIVVGWPLVLLLFCRVYFCWLDVCIFVGSPVYCCYSATCIVVDYPCVLLLVVHGFFC